ncbi:exonuclease domain-containing protein [Streptomyces jumonjinensis]|uniref:exonuclease domain-containing protein n=1 Tax=Streptomyces jumonjinensis TaxID=1945 RepID=UPI0037A017AF
MSTTTTAAGTEIPASRTETDPDRVPRGGPVAHLGGVPVYGWGDAPRYLRTQTQLGEQRLKLTENQPVVAWLRLQRHGDFPLYDPGAAVKMKPLAASTRKGMTARRTCPKCNKVRSKVVRGPQCSECWESERKAQMRRDARTCWGCRTEFARPLPKHRRCRECRKKQLAEFRAKAAAWIARVTICSGDGCSVKVVTKKEALAVQKRQGAERAWWQPADHWPNWCPPCTEAHERRQAEDRARWAREDRERREAEAREAREAAEKRRRWAADALADPDVVVLDTETTGLDGDARIVEIAVLSSSGAVLLDSLVDPGEPIPRTASRIHGITDDMIRSAAAPTFSDLLVRLTGVLGRKRVLIYNASFDRARLRYELTVHYQRAASAAGEAPETAAASAAAWLDAMTFEDVMHPYSAWCGDWSEYHGDYTWQPLNGGHRAAGDCRAVLDRLRSMGRDGQAEEFETAAAGGGRDGEMD